MNEGDRIKKGQFLRRSTRKPAHRARQLEASLRAIASLEETFGVIFATARTQVEEPRVQLEQMKANLKRQQDLWSRQLTTRETLEKAENDVMRAESDVKAAQSALQEREKTAKAQDSRIMQERATLENARYDLGKVRIESTIDGIVTRRNIQEGETAVIGTMNNAGTVLLELADMSVIQGSRGRRTNIPNVKLGQPAKILDRRDPGSVVQGHVSETATARSSPPRRAPERRRPISRSWSFSTSRSRRAPRLHLHGRHHDGDRKQVTAAPIPAVAVRELIYDAEGPDREGAAHRQAPPEGRRRRPPQSRRDKRGRRPKACSPSARPRRFMPISGHAGDKLEVLSGSKRATR